MTKPPTAPPAKIPLWFIITFILLAIAGSCILHMESIVSHFLD